MVRASDGVIRQCKGGIGWRVNVEPAAQGAPVRALRGIPTAERIIKVRGNPVKKRTGFWTGDTPAAGYLIVVT